MPERGEQFSKPRIENLIEGSPDTSIAQTPGTEFESVPHKKNEDIKKQRKIRYQEFLSNLEENSEKEYKAYWKSEARKSYLEQGAEFVVNIHEQSVDTIVFMDKSARPLAGFFRAIWNRVYPNKPAPAMRFLADDRHSMIHEPAKQIKQIFKNSQDVFDGKKVLIVDEWAQTGGTLFRAREMIGAAFPDIKQILAGGLTGLKAEDNELDIPFPVGSLHRASFGNDLGYVMHSKSSLEVEEVPGKLTTKAARQVPATKTWSYKLRQIGQYETLDKKSVEGIDKRLEEEAWLEPIPPWTKEESIDRLKQVKYAYEKLFE